MSTKTTNYELVKPELTDVPDITVLNANFDTIDTELKKKYDSTNKPSKSDVGLGNVPNVETNNQTPTYTEATKLAKLSSGEKLSVAFGKISKAITDLISHIGNKSNPHSVTASQVGALPLNGGTMTDAINFQSADNGSSKIFKNHSASADYGTEIADISKSGKKARLVLNASSGLPLAFYDENGNGGAIYGTHNKPSAADVGALSKSGGTVSGSINASGHIATGGKTTTDDGVLGVYLGSSGHITLQGQSAPTITFKSGGNTTDNNGQIGVSDDGTMSIISKNDLLLYNDTSYIQFNDTRFRSFANDTFYLGDSNYKWKAVYAVNGTIQTSDRNQKENIEEIGLKYEELFSRLKPVTFELIGNEHDRTHIGFVAQDVKEAMDEVELSATDFAPYCVDVKKEFDEETQTEVDVLDENGEPINVYSLRYSEFIALNTHMIQKLRGEIDKLKEEIASLKSLNCEGVVDNV